MEKNTKCPVCKEKLSENAFCTNCQKFPEGVARPPAQTMSRQALEDERLKNIKQKK